jgi:hypothetical protein
MLQSQDDLSMRKYRVSYPFRRLLLVIFYRCDRTKDAWLGLSLIIIANANLPKIVMGQATITRAVTKCSHCLIIADSKLILLYCHRLRRDFV